MSETKAFWEKWVEAWDKAGTAQRMRLKLVFFAGGMTLHALSGFAIFAMLPEQGTYSSSDEHLMAVLVRVSVGIAFVSILALALFYGIFMWYMKWAWRPYHKAFTEMCARGEDPILADKKVRRMWRDRSLGKRLI